MAYLFIVVVYSCSGLQRKGGHRGQEEEKETEEKEGQICRKGLDPGPTVQSKGKKNKTFPPFISLINFMLILDSCYVTKCFYMLSRLLFLFTGAGERSPCR